MKKNPYLPQFNLEVRLKHIIADVGIILPYSLLLIINALVIVALFTYHPLDSAWSTTGKTDYYYNYLSKLGAFFSDFLLYLFGRSIWIINIVGLLWSIKILSLQFQQIINIKELRLINTTPQHTNNTSHNIPPYQQELNTLIDKINRVWTWKNALYLIAWLMTSSALESLRFNQINEIFHSLPFGAGGVLGVSINTLLLIYIPELLLVIGLLIMWGMCAAMTFNLSLLKLFEILGSVWDDLKLKQHDKKELKQDLAQGQVRQAERQAQLESLPEHFPMHDIEIQQLTSPTIPMMATPPSPPPSSVDLNIERQFPPLKQTSMPLTRPLEFDLNIAPLTTVQPLIDSNDLNSKLIKNKNDKIGHYENTVNTLNKVNILNPPHSIKPIKPINHYALPSLSLLDKPDEVTEFISKETLEYTSRLIEKKLRDYNVIVKVVAAQPGPVVTRYEIEPADGVKGSQIVTLARDLARSLSITSIRVVETIPGKITMGLELPNPKRQTVRLSEILGSAEYLNHTEPLTMALGKDITGEPMMMDLAKMPHLLVAGTTGSGKSVGINAMILSLLYKATPEQARLILIDPKMLELSVYEGIPHLLAPVVTDMRQASSAVNWCVNEMERRYQLMSRLGVRGIAGFNEKITAAQATGDIIFNPLSATPDAPEPLKPFSYIVLVVDELADLLMVVGKKIEEPLARLAQKSRACGIHLILATQRPSADVLTGLIRSNIPARIAFQVSTKTDSRIILDQMGADALLGNGDMLYLPKGSIPIRVHGAFVSDEEVVRVANRLREQGEPDYVEGILEDDKPEIEINEAFNSDNAQNNSNSGHDVLYDKAVEIVLSTNKASVSNIQRQLRVGYQRAARMIDAMEAAGLISAPEHNGNRIVLVKQ